jgi:hypothetical protein
MVFADMKQAIIPFVPTDSPRLSHLVYEMILAYFMAHDRQALFKTIKDWPKEIYDVPAVIVALQSELDCAPSPSTIVSMTPDTKILMECLAELLVNYYPLIKRILNYHVQLRCKSPARKGPAVFPAAKEAQRF